MYNVLRPILHTNSPDVAVELRGITEIFKRQGFNSPINCKSRDAIISVLSSNSKIQIRKTSPEVTNVHTQQLLFLMSLKLNNNLLVG